MKSIHEQVEDGTYDAEVYQGISTMHMVREAAYYLWLAAGQPTGRDEEFWCAAERQVIGYTVDEFWREWGQTALLRCR